MKKYYIKSSLIILIIVFSFAVANFSLAGLLDSKTTTELEKLTDDFSGEAGFTAGMEPGEIVAAVIKGFLALLGVIFIILIIHAGYRYMMARGNEEQVKEARDQIRRAIIGLLIIIAAYAITYFVFSYLPWGPGVGPGGSPPL